MRAVWLVLFAAACTGETQKDDGSGAQEGGCVPEEGQWSLAMTLVDGSDPLCPEVEEGSFEQDNDTDSTEGCEVNCTCQLTIDDAGCTALYEESCADSESESDFSCDLEIEDPTHMSGTCSVAVNILASGISVTCDYTVEASR